MAPKTLAVLYRQVIQPGSFAGGSYTGVNLQTEASYVSTYKVYAYAELVG
jgi:hypothetical protein